MKYPLQGRDVLFTPYFFRALLSHLCNANNIHANHLEWWLNKKEEEGNSSEKSPQTRIKLGILEEVYTPQKVYSYEYKSLLFVP